MRSPKTNIFGPVNLACAVLPHFRSKESGFLGFVGSQAEWKGDPGASAYCAGKFAQEGKQKKTDVLPSLSQSGRLTNEVPARRNRRMPTTRNAGFWNQDHHIRAGILPHRGLQPEEHQARTHEHFRFRRVQQEVHRIRAAGLWERAGVPKKAIERMIDVVKEEGWQGPSRRRYGCRSGLMG
jgi:NAD(P)-dependent dehydrogenase (short-subunit alcohol dehydrogenase family)